ncbi:MAG: iron-sulfur cluster assembly scaffold protein [Chloroflexi bacterium]|nr:iron-sulfur cluster assembly scaffold protein [Chloroflexota bacterium]
MSEVRFSAITVDHFQHPRNIGRLAEANAVGRIDDAATDTMVEIYVKFEAGRVARATFRTFGCSACIAASSMATELLVGRVAPVSAAELDTALGGLPADKRYCAELVAEAAQRALTGTNV